MNGMMSLIRSFSKGVPHPVRSPKPRARAARGSLACTRSIGRRIAVGQHKDDWIDFLLGDEIIENHMRDTALCPLLFLVSADAVEQIQHRILPVPGIARRSVNLHPALYADGPGVVINPFKFAVRDVVAPLVE